MPDEATLGDVVAALDSLHSVLSDLRTEIAEASNGLSFTLNTSLDSLGDKVDGVENAIRTLDV